MRLSPYARKEESLFIIFPLVLIFGILLFAKPFSVYDFILIIFLFVLSAFSAYFFRHPKRNIKPDDKILYSPADARITEIETRDKSNEFLNEPCVHISMFLSVFNVHINRNPCEGKVAYQKYKKGKFIGAYHKHCAEVNESNEVGLSDVPHYKLCIVKQISGAVARRIVSALKEGDFVEQCIPFGMIKFGSRTDVLFPKPEKYEILVKKGDRVRAGVTPLVRFLVGEGN